MSDIDPIQLRNAFGAFVTGVTVVTCSDSHGKAVGMTVNSFSSVSLDPPMCLWSVAKTATNFSAFRETSHFSIHILNSDQEQVSRHFSSKSDNKFFDVTHKIGLGNTPLLSDFSARFECEVEHCYEGGDHLILVGNIIDFDTFDKEPLAFYKGQYGKFVTA